MLLRVTHTPHVLKKLSVFSLLIALMEYTIRYVNNIQQKSSKLPLMLNDINVNPFKLCNHLFL